MSTFGFKEWQLVCDVMERGQQHVLLRKGGISEGKRGFQWLHQAFFLFPTWFHEQAGQLRLDPGIVLPGPPTAEREQIEIRLFARIRYTAEIDDLEAALSLRDLHVWSDAVIRERFGWGEHEGISLALLETYRLAQPWVLANRKSFGGCRSWLGLPEEEGLPQNWEPTLTPAFNPSDLDAIQRRLESCF